MGTENDSLFKEQLTIVSALGKVSPHPLPLNSSFRRFHLSVSSHWTPARCPALREHLLLPTSPPPSIHPPIHPFGGACLHQPAACALPRSVLTRCRPDSGTVHYLLQGERERENKKAINTGKRLHH